MCQPTYACYTNSAISKVNLNALVKHITLQLSHEKNKNMHLHLMLTMHISHLIGLVLLTSISITNCYAN